MDQSLLGGSGVHGYLAAKRTLQPSPVGGDQLAHLRFRHRRDDAAAARDGDLINLRAVLSMPRRPL